MASDGQSPATRQVRQVPFAEAKLAARAMAESFVADEVARYFLLVPDCDQKLTPKEEKLNLQVYECLTAAHCLSGLVFATGPQYDSVALWLPPGSMWNWKTYWKSGMWWLGLRLGCEGRRRFFGSWDSFEDAMVRAMGERASKTWILTDLGTRTASRGKGYAGDLMKHGLALVCLSLLTSQFSVG